MEFFKSAPKRDSSNKIVSGVCSGIARSVQIDPFWVRMAFILFIAATGGLGIVLYALLVVMMEDGSVVSEHQAATPRPRKKNTSTSSKAKKAAATRKASVKKRAKKAKDAEITSKKS